MSLDVWLESDKSEECPYCKKCYECNDTKVFRETLFDANITHNLNTMANEVGIYKHLWRPDELGIKRASELIDPLSKGLIKLKNEPEKFKKLNPSNGWGSYDGLIKFVESYLIACSCNPEAYVKISR